MAPLRRSKAAPTARLDIARGRLGLQLGYRDTRVDHADQLLKDRPRPAPRSDKISSTIEVAIGSSTADGMRAAAWDKASGEWKARATGGRKTDFQTAGTKHDHNLGRDCELIGRRRQQSNFFITLNTNRRTFDEAQDPKAVQEALNACFGKKIYDILTFGPAHPEVYGDDSLHPNEFVEKIEVRAGVERGPVTGALHCHAYVTIAHWSQIRINKLALQGLFKQAYNQAASAGLGQIPMRALPACKIELQAQTDSGHIVAHYLSKQVNAVTS
mmetsp:Transcript_28324/g.65098  ORF Transcript_28324/g.65098 Transcript_28324/m.65098 type:complete len:271 (-) Transcript_28324:59-871(-)